MLHVPSPKLMPVDDVDVSMTTLSLGKQLAAAVGMAFGFVLSGFKLPPPTVVKIASSQRAKSFL